MRRFLFLLQLVALYWTLTNITIVFLDIPNILPVYSRQSIVFYHDTLCLWSPLYNFSLTPSNMRIASPCPTIMASYSLIINIWDWANAIVECMIVEILLELYMPYLYELLTLDCWVYGTWKFVESNLFFLWELPVLEYTVANGDVSQCT